MENRSRYRQLILLLVALVLPSLAAVLLGGIAVRQQRELLKGRVAETQQQAISQIRKDLTARLERITFQEVRAAEQPAADTARDPLVEIVAWTNGSHLELPWD